MNWHEALSGHGFRTWLLNIASGSTIPQGQPLDPFITSMRVLKNVSYWLIDIEENQSLSSTGRGADQAIIDLTSAHLVERQDSGVYLTDLGKNVLEEWTYADLDNNEDDDEIPRCYILVKHAFSLHIEKYLEMVKFWKEIREIYPITDLLNSPEALYLLSYLNQAIDGYNPWHVIQVVCNGDVQEELIDWGELISQMPDTDESISGAIENLTRRVNDYATRATGRLNFCRAMELFLMEQNEAHLTIDRWDIPERTRDRCHYIIPGLLFANIGNQKTREVFELLYERSNVILYGPPGTGKTYHALEISSLWEQRNGPRTVFRVTFHPTYSYEDFVEGFKPIKDQPGEFELQDGILKKACNRCNELIAETPDRTPPQVLLLIDEINRGDVSRVFGELITYIEADKRNEPFSLAQSPDNEYFIPENLNILGTMNTADKSISLLDIALRRRFAFYEMPPDNSFFDSSDIFLGAVEGIELSTLLEELNNRLEDEGIEPDRALGHALLAISTDTPNPIGDLKKKIMYDIYPLISEYCYNDRGRVKRILGNLVSQDGRLAINNTAEADFLDSVSSIINRTSPPLIDETLIANEISSDDLSETDTESDGE